MAKQMVSDFVISRLQQWGVEYLFGYPGDGINGLMGALNRAGNRPQLVQARHEEMAAFEAVGYAKFTGKPGVCIATSGPGAIHLLNGLYDAKLDHVPVVAIVGQQARTALGGHYQQEVDLVSLFKDVASEYVQMATKAEQFPLLIDRAMRIAMSQHAPTCIIVPTDLQEEPYESPGHTFKEMLSSDTYEPSSIVPRQDDLRRAAEILNEGERVAMLVGQGARGARAEVLQVADLLGAGIAKALLGKDVVPDDNPIVTGAIGLLGTRPSYDLMMECDTLLMVGSSFPYSQFLPEFGKARGVQIDIDARMIGIRYPMDVNLVGDAAATLQALMPMLERKSDRSWQQGIEEGIRKWWSVVEARAGLKAEPVNPQYVFWELSPRLPDDAIVCADSGSAANWYARDLKFRGAMRGSLSGTLATMGPGVPYAIGAKFGNPSRPVFAVVGDGAMQMNGLNELLTISKYYKQWADPRLVVLVLHNNDLNQVTWEMRAMAGDPKFEASQDLPEFDYAGYADLVGLIGIHVDKPEQVGPAWDRAIAADRPVVIDAVTDPEVPPLPPHVEFEQAKALMSAVLKGDPASGEIVRQGFKGKLQ
ncbi:MAG TPA: thiamine pyrophosphate-requiring protein, partial [Acidimicrobiales bacterium]|nr:thiamine pyrophosphate-requiring protein [Acidimicrobiales bacterium]